MWNRPSRPRGSCQPAMHGFAWLAVLAFHTTSDHGVSSHQKPGGQAQVPTEFTGLTTYLLTQELLTRPQGE